MVPLLHYYDLFCRCLKFRTALRGSPAISDDILKIISVLILLCICSICICVSVSNSYFQWNLLPATNFCLGQEKEPVELVYTRIFILCTFAPVVLLTLVIDIYTYRIHSNSNATENAQLRKVKNALAQKKLLNGSMLNFTCFCVSAIALSFAQFANVSFEAKFTSLTIVSSIYFASYPPITLLLCFKANEKNRKRTVQNRQQWEQEQGLMMRAVNQLKREEQHSCSCMPEEQDNSGYLGAAYDENRITPRIICEYCVLYKEHSDLSLNDEAPCYFSEHPSSDSDSTISYPSDCSIPYIDADIVY